MVLSGLESRKARDDNPVSSPYPKKRKRCAYKGSASHDWRAERIRRETKDVDLTDDKRERNQKREINWLN